MTTSSNYTLILPSGVRLDVADRGTGPVVVFLHGYTDSWRSYEPILGRLPDDVRALAVSQRGHGDSDRPPSGYRIRDLAADVNGLLEMADITDATVVGHSMGSLVAQELAMSHPERISRIVLIGSAISFDTPVLRELADAVSTLGDSIPESFAWEFQASTLHLPVPEEFLQTVVHESLKVPARVWRDALDGQLTHREAGRLARLAIPTLIVGGDRDEIAVPAEQERLHRAIKNSTYLRYEDTGHATHWERPQRFTDDLLAFLRATAIVSDARDELYNPRDAEPITLVP